MLMVLQDRIARLEAQAPDAERERLTYLVKYASKPNDFMECEDRCCGSGGRGRCGGCGGRGVCRMHFPTSAVYSKAKPAQPELTDNMPDDSSECRL